MVVNVGSETVNFIMSDAMPIGVTEQTIANADGSYTVLLNGKYGQDALRKASEHAIYHIKNHDFERLDNVQQIEAEAHGFVEPDKNPDDLTEWAIEMIRDLVLRTLTAEAMAEYYRKASLDRITDMEFRLQEDKWLYDV